MEIHEQSFSIAEISNKLNVPKHTLRFWEKEFRGGIVPLRTRGGQRRYTAQDVAAIERIKSLRERGLSLSEIKKVFTEGNREGQDSIQKIDVFSKRVAEVVKTEVYNFLMVEERNK
jgi:DNA-binding transcriptional MerR regulator